MTPIAVHPGTPAGLDVLDVDAVVLPMYAVRAQPLGAAGFVDWRLCGRIARLVRSGRFAGAAGEVLLLSPLARMGTVERVFLFGLGRPSPGVPELPSIVRVLADARVRDFAIAPPVLSKVYAVPPPAEVARAWWPLLAVAAFARVLLLDADGSCEGQAFAV